jgi:hypothetical protein
MMKLLMCDACIVKGEHVQIGSEIVTDEATAKVLISMGRAVAAPDPEPQPEVPKPPSRPRARATHPTTPEQEA